MEFRRRSWAVSIATAAFAVVSVLWAGPASATAYQHSCSTPFGVYTCTDGYLVGSGLTINYTKLNVTADSSGVYHYPNFSGCTVHMQTWNNLKGTSYRSWNSSSISCSKLAENGYGFLINIQHSEPAALYCSTLWFGSGSNYANTGYACVLTS